MNSEAIPYIAVGISLIINVATLAAFVAKMNARLDFHDERLKELRYKTDAHISNNQLHKDTQAFAVQFDHIEKQMTNIQTEMRQTRESLTQRIDELHKSLVDGQ
jgi:division protein CdvB (Snf7/Vps24/ESCRT-III family)